MKSAWEALHGPVRQWYGERLTLENYFASGQTFHAEVNRLLRALAEHDQSTAWHARRVGRYAEWLGQELGLDQAACEQLKLAAQLHDVGKLCVPGALLRRPGPLTEAERCLVQEHAAFGERLVRAITPCPAVQQAVRWHHERFDGQGYPDGLRGEEIPLFARLLAVADTFDALTGPRLPARTLSWHDALAEIRRCAGQQFDPVLVACFADILARHEGTLVSGAPLVACLVASSR